MHEVSCFEYHGSSLQDEKSNISSLFRSYAPTTDVNYTMSFTVSACGSVSTHRVEIDVPRDQSVVVSTKNGTEIGNTNITNCTNIQEPQGCFSGISSNHTNPASSNFLLISFTRLP